MVSTVRDIRPAARGGRYNVLSISSYDVETWDPLDDFDDSYHPPKTLDLSVIASIGSATRGIMESYNLLDAPVHNSRVEGEEVGDDRVDFSNNPWKLACGLVCQQQVMHMVTSEDDTTISPYLWNFCETTSTVPAHKGQSFDKCRKVGDFKDLGFIDVPPLRILLDVMKGDRSHSSTAVGKATMLGSRMRTPRTEFLHDFHLASFLQDGFLRTNRMSEPKYLPQIMGGSGVRALFSNPLNLYLYVKAYRNGRCDRIYGSATRELRQSLDSLEQGKRVIMPILNRRLRDRQEYLHATYDAKIFIPTREYMTSFKETLPPPLMRESGGANLFASFENRLIRTRHVVTRSSAEREWANTLRIRDRLLLRGTTTVEGQLREDFERKAARRRFGMALNANTAFANLLERTGSLKDVIQLTDDNFTVVNCGATTFTKWDADWLFYGGKGDTFSIEDLTSSEDLFLRSEVSEEETMKVGSILLRPIAGNQRLVLTTTTVGLYEIGSGMYEWASNLASRLVERRDRNGCSLSPAEALEEYKVDPEWINDDTLIISRCRHDSAGRAQRSTVVALVSADRRLANQLSNSCNVTVFAIHPTEYIQLLLGMGKDPKQELDPLVLNSYIGGVHHPVQHVYVDTGSVNSFLSRIEETTDRKMLITRSIESSGGRTKSDLRVAKYVLQTVDISDNLHPKRYFPVQNPKRFRSNSDPFGSEKSSRRSTMSHSSRSTVTNWRERM